MLTTYLGQTGKKRNLERLFGSKIRVKILSVLLKNKDRAFYQREVMYLTGGSLNAIQRELSNLTEIGLLLRSDGTSRVYYKINEESPLFEPVSSIFQSFK